MLNIKPAVASQVTADKTFLGNAYARTGMYSKEEIKQAKFNNYSRFGRIMDGHGRLNNTTEYLFFVKPDLHIVSPAATKAASALRINPEIESSLFFQDLVNIYPDVVRELQYSAYEDDPFSHLLSFCVNSRLDLPGMEATTMDNPQTMVGNSYEYMGNSEASDEGPTFSLEFVDSKDKELYMFFRAYQEYHIFRKNGNVSPPSREKYTFKRRLHNTMGVYKFLVADDMETLIHWSYMWGTFPISCPREAFSDSSFPEGLTYTVSWKGAFVEDMAPEILINFNKLMTPLVSGKTEIPVCSLTDIIETNDKSILYSSSMFPKSINGKLPTSAYVMRTKGGADSYGNIIRPKYKLLWF